MRIDIDLLPKKFNEVNYFKKTDEGCEIYSYSKNISERNEVLIVKLNECEIENDVCVDNKALEMIKVLYPCDITITEKSFIIKSTNGKGKYTSKLLNEQWFNLVLDAESTVIQTNLSILNKASQFVAKGNQKPVLMGVRIDLNGNIYATDSFRAYFYAENDLVPEGFTLPVSFINNIKLLSNNESNIDIKISKNIVYYVNNNITICSRLIEGMYPNMSKIYSNFARMENVEIDKADLLDKISIANNVGADSDKNTIIILNKNHFEAMGSNNYEADVKYDNGNKYQLKIALNYLEQALKTIESNDIEFGVIYDDNNKLSIMTFVKKENEVCLILAIR